MGISGCRLTYFYEPLYMTVTVTCSAFAFGVQDYGLFWETTSGCIPYPAPVGSTLDTCSVSLLRLSWFRLQKTVESPQLQSIMVVDISCRGAEADSYGPCDHRDSTVCLRYGDRCPCLQVAQIFPVVVQMPIPMVQTFCRTTEIPQLLDTVVDAPVKQVAGSRSSTSLSWRRGLLPWSGLFVGPRVSPVAAHGDRCPCYAGLAASPFTSLSWRRDSFPWSCGPWRFRNCSWTRCSTFLFAGGESSTGAPTVVKTVVLPQLHLS